MKRLYFFLLASLSVMLFGRGGQTPLQAQTLPTFTESAASEAPTWYYIQFLNGKAVIEDRGQKEYLLTADAVKGDTAQLWKLVGTKDKFYIVSRAGRYVYLNGSYFAASTGSRQSFCLVPSGADGYENGWEIQRASNTGYSINQWGGAGTGYNLGEWYADDANNPVQFVLENEMEYPDVEPDVLDEYSYIGTADYLPSELLTLWYTDPVTAAQVDDPWMEYALPVGTGDFGGMVYGGMHQERIQFNEKSLWTGSPTLRGAYQNFGCLYLTNPADNLVATGYRRELCLADATARTYYEIDGVGYTQEVIASYPAHCIAIRLSASEAGKLSRLVTLYNAAGGAAPTYTDEGYATFQGDLDLVSYAACLRVIPTGGTMEAQDGGIMVDGADEILLLLTGKTNFAPRSMSYIDEEASVSDTVRAIVDNAAAQGWDNLYAEQQEDYTALFDRVTFELDGAANTMDTEALVTAYNAASDPAASAELLLLEQLYFHYGRYLLIASSRGIDLPANLQGIWNHKSAPPWESDYHSNINVQMNYWPAETTNLSELHMPFLNYLYNMAVTHTEWQSYATDSGQTTGWTCYTQNNPFGHSNYMTNYVIANAWYCSHLWQHYRYTLDEDFLANTAFPVMLSCAHYWMERLKEDDTVNDGTLVCPDEWSPEHGPDAEDATAHAQQLVWDLFNNTLAALDVLGDKAGVEEGFAETLRGKFDSLDTGLHKEVYQGTFSSPRNGVYTGDTILREWKYSTYAVGNSGESTHRHLSHMMCLHPCNQIDGSSEYFQPLVRSLLLRGDESTGWSMGWKINLWARALDGDHAHTILQTALKHSISYSTDQTAGGIYYNLFDSHAPFQIDGNFGATAGVAEMLLQSYADTLCLLPALPEAWPAGTATGLCAVGGFTVDMKWKEGNLTSFIVTSRAGQTCQVSYPGVASATVAASNGATVELSSPSDNAVSFATEAGASYTFILDENEPVVGIEAIPSPDEGERGESAAAERGRRMAYDLSGRPVASAPSDTSIIIAADGTKRIR